MATALGSSAVSLNSPTLVRWICVNCYDQIWLMGHCIFLINVITRANCLLTSPWKWGPWLWCETDRNRRRLSFPFLQIHLPPWAFVPPPMWYSPHADATAVQNTKLHVDVCIPPPQYPLRQSAHLPAFVNNVNFCSMGEVRPHAQSLMLILWIWGLETMPYCNHTRNVHFVLCHLCF